MPNLAPAYSMLVASAILSATLGLGALVARPFRLTERGVARLIWEAAIGFLAATLLLTLAGLAGMLDHRAIVIATLVGAVGGVVRLQRFFREPASTFAAEPTFAPPWLTRTILAAAGLVTVASFIGALAPPTAGDAICYHLELPKRFLQQGGIDFRADDDNITYPLLAEMGFLWALAFDAPAAAATTQWLCGLLMAGAAYVFSVPYVGRRGAQLAAAVVLLTPGVNNQMTAPLNDLMVAAYCALATAAWERRRHGGSVRDDALIGVMLGGAVGVKYTALVFVAALGAAWLVAALEDVGRRRELLRSAACTLLIATLVGGVWYVRTAWHRGDPLYPFFSAGHAVGEPSRFPESKRPLGRGPTAVVAAPWAMTMEPARFGGRAHQFGPLFLMFVPVGAVLGFYRGLSRPMTVAIFYFLGCVALRQNVRFLLPLVPTLAAVVVVCWREVARWPRASRTTIVGAVALVLAFQSAIAPVRLRHIEEFVLGDESPADYLTRTEPTYEAARWMNEHLPPTAHVLSQEQRAFYIDAAVTRENIFRRRTQYDAEVSTGGDLVPTLRNAGFTHVLTAAVEGSPGAGYDGTLCRLVDAAVDADNAKTPRPLQAWRHREADGTTRHYRLFSLE